MERQRGQVNLARGAVTFFLLAIVLAIGFVVGRVMVARTYAEAMPKVERPPVAEPEVAAKAEPEQPFLPGAVSVPPPAPPEEPPEEALEEGLEEGLEGEATETGTATTGQPAPGPRPGAGRVARGPVGAPREAPAPEPEIEPPSPLIAPVRPPTQTEEPEGARYSIQIGVFALRAGARQVADELTRAGYPAQIEVRTAEDQTLYRVLTGQYHTEYAARKALEELQKEGFEGFLVRR